MSANPQAREREFRENAQDAQGVSFWGGAGAFASDATLAQWMGGEKPDTALRDKPPQATTERDEEARLFALIENGSMVELGAGTNLPQWLKDRLAGRGHGGENYSFGEPGSDFDGDGVRDDEENKGYSSRRQSLISYMIDTAIADIDYQLAKNREELDLISRELDQLIPLYEKLTRDLGEKGAQVAEQKNLVANDQKALDAAIIDADKAKIEFTAQNQVVERKQTEVTTQEGVVAQKTVEEQQAAQDLTVAKENTAVKTEEKVAADQQVEKVTQSYAELANGTTSYINAQGNRADIFKMTGPDGKEILVTGGGASLSDQEMSSLREANKNPDGSLPSDADLLAKAKQYDAGKMASVGLDYLRADNETVYKDTALKSAQKDEQKAQSVWETAADSLKTETQKLDTLKHELADEQKKLDEKERVLAEKQQKVEEAKEALANDKEKLAKLEAEYAEIAKQREEVKVKIDDLKEKQAKLIAENEKLEAAKTKLSDPAYQAKLKGMKPEEAAAELDKLGISAEAKAQIAAEIKNAAPEPAPAKGATPSPTAEALVAKAGSEPITLAPSSAAKDAEPETWPPASEASSKMAFTAAANQTTAPTTTPAAPALEEEELKNQPTTLAAAAPKALTPAAIA